jgi:hypothetical protein
MSGRERLIVALACSIALHEIVFGFLHARPRHNALEHPQPAEIIVIATPRPTPKPRPTPVHTPPPPTPPPNVTPPPHVTPMPIRQIAAAAKGEHAKARGGGMRHALSVHKSAARPASTVAVGAGTGTNVGEGSGIEPGEGGGEAGNGQGNSGNGNGAVNADTPCGEVDFLPHGAPVYRNGTASEIITATVKFGDGHSQDVRFPYPWVYPDGEKNDPWSSTNLKNPDLVVPLQLPPPGLDTSSWDPLILYILKHTNASGFTDLVDCPKR